ncbi:MAG: DNA gyrase subunit A [Candidatus Woesebacteria bacterium]|nr:MAG: DNA gyrase subunit A [Candidatus Woesebacteria bacterium]
MDIGKIQPVELTEELSKSYLDYAMSVIVARALPDIRDGLKPVHRRILYAMHTMGLQTGKTTKCAKVVGEVLGKYHPHGDTAVYDALVRLAQDFSMRYPLVEGQGNFGSVDGDPPAAMRYTEAKLASISEWLLKDIDKETVNFIDNFDATLKEPDFMPALLPNLLLMGSEGIAVGMATKIPPHNLKEVIDAIIAAIQKGRPLVDGVTQEEKTEFIVKKIELVASGEKKELEEVDLDPKNLSFETDITVPELTNYLPGPDFPTGGAIYDSGSLVSLYETGRGKISVRGIAEIVEGAKGKSQIIITEIPYQVNKALLVVQIADLVKNKKIVGVSALRDESDKDGMRVVVDLKRDARPKAVLNNLYKYTRLQSSFPANFVALIDGTPHTVNLKQIVVEYVRHRQKVIVRRTIFELTNAKKRAHILEGLKIALDHLDEVIKTIRSSRTQEDAKKALIEKFGLSEIQSTAILDMQLRRLAALEREKIEKEYEEIKKLIDRLTLILKNPQKVLNIIIDELTDIKEKFGDKRKTKIYKAKLGEIRELDLVPKEDVLITVTKTGYIKRVPKGTFKSQRRGGKGVMGMTTKDDDEIEHLITATTHDTLLFFTDKGRVFGNKAWEVQEGSRQAKGQSLVNLINLDQGEQIKSILPVHPESKNLIMATLRGTIKKTKTKEFENLRTNGLIAIKLSSNDSLVSVHETSGEDFILILTKNGKAIKFPEENARAMGRATSGVRGIKLNSSDEVIEMEVFPKKEPERKDKRSKIFRDIMIITQKGLGKRTSVDLFPNQKRGGKGVKAANLNSKTGPLASAKMVTQKDDQAVLTSKYGQVIRIPLRNIPELGRATQGVILMRFADKSDEVAAVTTLEKTGEDKEI